MSLTYEGDVSPPTDSTLVNPNVSATLSAIVENSTSTPVEVRVGYLGMCVLLAENFGQWICSRKSEQLARIIIGDSPGSQNDTDDPLNLIFVAGKFKDDVVFEGLL